uniref:Uncharacterized protein n=1 Tax=Romanomermis culicivorax TaxID=13658 RepID=A0A915HS52_ROMCU
MSMCNSFKMERDKFSAKDDETMCFMLYRLLKKNNDDATLPCGLKVWNKIRSMGYLMNHTDHSLASHMRRYIFPKFESIAGNLPPEVENYLRKAYRRYIFPMRGGNFLSKKSSTLSSVSSVQEDGELSKKDDDVSKGEEEVSRLDQPPIPKISSNRRKIRSKENSQNKGRSNIIYRSNLSALTRNSEKKSRKSSKAVKSAKISTLDGSADSIEMRISESGSNNNARVDILLEPNQTEYDVSSGFEASDVAHESSNLSHPTVASRIEKMIKSLSKYEANTTAVSAMESSSSEDINSSPKIVKNVGTNCYPEVEAGPSSKNIGEGIFGKEEKCYWFDTKRTNVQISMRKNGEGGHGFFSGLLLCYRISKSKMFKSEKFIAEKNLMKCKKKLAFNRLANKQKYENSAPPTAFTTSTPKDPCALPNLDAEFILPKSTDEENRPSNERFFGRSLYM